jgi:hypothetical protein
MEWEEAAVKARVPSSIPGLISRKQGSNYRWLLKATSIERNGDVNIFNPLFVRRLALGGFFFCFVYQYLRVLTFGYTSYLENHSFNKDNIVYDKLSQRQVPYHYPCGLI